MERRFELRKGELLADCHVHPAVFAGMMERLDQFAEPFAARLRRPEQRAHTRMYLQGLLSDVERKNAEAIAYRHDENRQELQTFLGTAPWDYQLSGANVAWLAPSYRAFPDGHMVLGVGRKAGKKNGRPRSRFRRYANASHSTCVAPAAATRRRESPASANAGWNASSLHGSITTRHVTDCRHEGFINVDNPRQ